jgi:hypothetical protein
MRRVFSFSILALAAGLGAACNHVEDLTPDAGDASSDSDSDSDGDTDADGDADTDADADADSDSDSGSETIGCDSDSEDLQSGLVAYYPFDGNAADESGNGNDGTVHGAALTDDRFGNADRAFVFDGQGDYIDCGNGNSLRISGAMTICAWIRIDAFSGGNQGIVAKWIGAVPSNERSYGLVVENQGHCHDQKASHTIGGAFSSDGSCVAGGSDACSLTCGDEQLPAGVWRFVAVTYDPGVSIRLYVDGELAGSAFAPDVVPSLFDNTANLLIGVQYSLQDAGMHFDGAIDDVRIYDRALDGCEIEVLYFE